MAASKLYPTLSPFYRNNYIGFGSEKDIPENKLCRKGAGSDKNNQHHKKSDVNHSKKGKDINLMNSLYPRERHTRPSLDLYSPVKIVPSAPPLDLSNEELVSFIENALADPAQTSDLGYSASNLSWVDDLLPDYDISKEEISEDVLNNLNVELSKETKVHKEKSLEMDMQAGHQKDTELSKRSKKTKSTLVKDDFRHEIVHQDSQNVRTGHPDSGPEQSPSGHRQAGRYHAKQKESRRLPPVQPETTDGISEYEAWMTWRKQVNRQLATVIMLRNGAQVFIQRGDMCRKALDKRSIDYVSNIAETGNITSLGGKPFVMYGIPRASLSRPDILY